MRYSEPLTGALTIVWRHPYLWLLALLGGADVSGSSGNFGFPSFPSGSGSSPSGTAGGGSVPGLPTGGVSALGPYAASIAATLLLAALVLLVVVVIVLVVSCVTQPALVRAAAEHDADRPFGFGLAWRTGRRFFWRVLGLRLLALAAGLVLALPLALIGFIGVFGAVNNSAGLLAFAVGAGILYFLAVIVAAVAIGIVFILSLRALVLEELGLTAALSRAAGLFGRRLGRTLLVWLLQVAVAIGIQIALVLAIIVVALPIVGIALALNAAAGIGGAIAGGVVGGLALLGLVFLAYSITSAYLSAYWTLAYRRLDVDMPRF
ncbi:MAG: hypothetical protein M3024_11305 [Candidatus Dormibacteraeota bacterium]|nr:hypothetical protein [Candidatus Dormibacteraeota bacterium]